LIWRARIAVPSLLAGRDERNVISFYAAATGGTAILIIGALAWLIDLPLLFPALGPSAFILLTAPFSRAAAPRSVIVGHSVGIATGFIVWQLASLLYGGPVNTASGGWPVLLSPSLAMAIVCMLLAWLSCPHAPACASTVIASLGAARGWPELLGMAGGVVLLTAQAVVIGRLAGINMPLWRPRPRHAAP
jgi:hypothetical protein